ncbi:MAG: translation elongation factor Ts [Candidatus Pacebacteria bacterium]|nr:translation elongation factor Ts [Candidatus Paceibacterota bacterium]
MTEINIDLIKDLRNQTGVSIMQCKKALEEAEGDLEKAKIALTKRSGEIAAKKGDRELGAGVVTVKDNLILELACETDFVANNEEFKNLAEQVIEVIIKNNLDVVEDNEEVATILSEGTQKFGERIEVIRFEKYSGNVGSYVHVNNSVGAMVEFSTEVSDELAKDISMHITAQHPRYLKEEDINEEERQKAIDTLKEEVADKPADMQEKILAGKINSYFKERVLLTQGFIKDPSKTVAKLLEEAGTEIKRYTRFGVGEA